ncbi:MAG: hypothetical protein BGO82_01150 [Devosia sp. 67-54]|uniref:hypothetical protein n=1 Tax=unclassified Devosia TaxID=196773 RepID=UPI000968FEE6|nr:MULTISPECIES: hypothetical protein [unclassified Devosia]MBN9305929.1 hypothetical protein [Devosia sp.]OJX16381.1 MAG: hypothetical protein BGO82_01150 [Devosia sp. 67-54]
MSNLHKLAVVGLATAVTLSLASGAFALSLIKPVLKQAHHTQALDCTVRGFDLIITNFGDDNADSGRQVAWAVSTGDNGTMLLPKMLAPGERLLVADALTDFAARGSRCQVDYI